MTRPVENHDRLSSSLRVAFVTAEFDPIMKVGGLGEASAGLVSALRANNVEVEVIMPDYGEVALENEQSCVIDTLHWVKGATARYGHVAGAGNVTLINVSGMRRPHPYCDPDTGTGWADNDSRFVGFSCAVASLMKQGAPWSAPNPDVVHLNDWHTAPVISYLDPTQRTALTLHNVAHQGHINHGWLDALGPRSAAYETHDYVNSLAGGIKLADALVAVSPNYAREICEPENGHGLDELFRLRGDDLVGIRNGISNHTWNPMADAHLDASFNMGDLSGKRKCRRALLHKAGLRDSNTPVIGMVARLDSQKGVDIALSMASRLPAVPARLVLHGSGSPEIANIARQAANRHSGSVSVIEGYSDETAHQIMAGSDIALIPSRFEPCGLTQMQAMSYGTIPVVTDVGGLRDTVVDSDNDPHRGTGFVAAAPESEAVGRTLCRAVQGWRNPNRRSRMQQQGMGTDWSWDGPAKSYISVYEKICSN